MQKYQPPLVIIAFIYLSCSHFNLLQQQHSMVCCGSLSLCLSVTGQPARDYLLTPFACNRRLLPPTSNSVFKCSAQVRNFQTCLPVRCPIKAWTPRPSSFSLVSSPGVGCVIVCVFIFPGSRPAVGWNCVCGAGGEFFFFFRGVGLVLDSLGRRPFASCRGVSTAVQRRGIVWRCVLQSYWIVSSVLPTGRREHFRIDFRRPNDKLHL